MALRPGRTMREIERPYTRISYKTPRKSYVAGAPQPRIHHFEMGKKGSYELTLYLIAKKSVQIRDNALEAARIVAHKYLSKKIPGGNYFLKIIAYPHHVIREKPIATGAGADRYSQGMRLAFGKPVGRAVQAWKGTKIMLLQVDEKHSQVAKEALKKAGYKLPTPVEIKIERNS